MNEVSTEQIAMVLAGHPGDPSVELRVVMLFQSAAGRIDADRSALAEPDRAIAA
jgi:hypothetical protein